jgi:hypothetical protein
MFFAYYRCGRTFLAIALLGCAANASAQSADCEIYGREITCRPANSGGVARGIADFVARSKDNSVRKHVGEMLASGNCEEAGRYAYSKGRLELAQQILQSCRSSAAATSRQAQPTPSTTHLPDLLNHTAEALRAEPNHDNDFKLVRVEPVGNQLQLTISARSKQLGTLPEARRTQMMGAMCAEQTFLSLMHYGASVRIAFTDQDSRETGAILLTRQICGF